MARRRRLLPVFVGLGALGALLAFSGRASAEQPDDDDDDDDGDGVLPGITGGFVQPGAAPPDGGSVKPPVFELEPKPPDLDRWESPTPLAGSLYQVKRGDRFLGTNYDRSIVYRALYDFALAVARERGDDDPAAFARRVAGSATLRVQYHDLIQCSGWNDALYGTWGYGSKARVSPHGRAIRLIPVHPDNRGRIAMGLAPIRNIAMLTPADAGSGRARGVDPGYAEDFEFLWLPPINPDALYDQLRVTTHGLAWEDGSTLLWPPPEIANVGIALVDDPELPEYGCAEGVWRG